jgi:hypothetical protein
MRFHAGDQVSGLKVEALALTACMQSTAVQVFACWLSSLLHGTQELQYFGQLALAQAGVHLLLCLCVWAASVVVAAVAAAAAASAAASAIVALTNKEGLSAADAAAVQIKKATRARCMSAKQRALGGTVKEPICVHR